jgi:hypothetical protein
MQIDARTNPNPVTAGKLHLGQEPLWELRAICRRCHERIHGIDREEAIDL